MAKTQESKELVIIPDLARERRLGTQSLLPSNPQEGHTAFSRQYSEIDTLLREKNEMKIAENKDTLAFLKSVIDTVSKAKWEALTSMGRDMLVMDQFATYEAAGGLLLVEHIRGYIITNLVVVDEDSDGGSPGLVDPFADSRNEISSGDSNAEVNSS